MRIDVAGNCCHGELLPWLLLSHFQKVYETKEKLAICDTPNELLKLCSMHAYMYDWHFGFVLGSILRWIFHV